MAPFVKRKVMLSTKQTIQIIKQTKFKKYQGDACFVFRVHEKGMTPISQCWKDGTHGTKDCGMQQPLASISI